MNIRELQSVLQPNQAALIVSEYNRRYLTGFNATNGYLIVTHNGSVFITDSRYIEDAERIVTDARVVLQKQLYQQIEQIMREFGASEVLVEVGQTSIQTYSLYRKVLHEFSFNATNRLDIAIAELREQKLPEEIRKMQEAQRIAEVGFNETLPFIKVGVTERDVATELIYRMRKNGADGESFDTIVVSGEYSSKPHGVPGDRVIADGDFVTIDFGALYEGYHSDTTRTLAVGHVTEEMANVYNTVLKAQEAGCRALKPGLTASEYDGIARKIIDDAGYGEYFGHSLGHGVGIEIHEQPFCGPGSKGILKEGNVVSCEPGIYLPGKFGVRIEDMLEVTADGSMNFCSLPKELTVL